MKYLINYADDNYREAQKYCTKKAYGIAKFDRVIEYSPLDIPDEIVSLCEEGIYGQNRRAKRYGLWRPYIIKKTLEKMKDGDILCYCDAGGYFIRDISPIVHDMEKKKQNIRVYALPLIERQWTKRDVFIYLNADKDFIVNSNQILSTYFFIKKTDYTVALMDEYYRISVEMPELFTDEENLLNQPNYSDFIENRHNQSVLSVLCKINNIQPERDISEYGFHPKLYSFTKGVVYKPVEGKRHFPYFISHRRNKVDVIVHIGNILRVCLPPNMFIFILKIVIYIHDSYRKMKNVVFYLKNK